MVGVLYRHWTLPHVVTSSLPSTIFSVVSPPKLYHGPIGRNSWLLAIFSPSPQHVSRVTLVLSSGSFHRAGLPPPVATLDSLPEVVEVRRVVSSISPGSHRSVALFTPPPCVPSVRAVPRFPPRGEADCICSFSLLLRLLPATLSPWHRYLSDVPLRLKHGRPRHVNTDTLPRRVSLQRLPPHRSSPATDGPTPGPMGR